MNWLGIICSELALDVYDDQAFGEGLRLCYKGDQLSRSRIGDLYLYSGRWLSRIVLQWLLQMLSARAHVFVFGHVEHGLVSPMAILPEGFQCLVNECTECGGIHLAGGGGDGIEFENVLEAKTERAGEALNWVGRFRKGQ